jgi:hypothetical protein
MCIFCTRADIDMHALFARRADMGNCDVAKAKNKISFVSPFRPTHQNSRNPKNFIASSEKKIFLK